MSSNTWHKFLSGNDTAFSLLYEEFSGKLFIYALKLGFDEEVCKDAIHDVFYTIFTLRKKLTHVKNIEFYLLHSVKNRLFDLYRKEKTIDPLNHDEIILDSNEIIVDRLINIETKIQLKETVNQLLNKLTLKQRRVVHCRYVLNMKNSEIAVMMDITPGAVKKILQRALQAMRANSKDTPDFIVLMLIIFSIG